MQLSDKQKEFWNAGFHRWSVKYGATRTGKTFMDYFTIPRRIRERMGKDGLVVLLGNTKGTLQRNVIEPMQNIWGAGIVSSIRSDNTASIFGEKVHCLGADSKKHVDRLRGTSIKYCYGDEVVTWEREVFEMLKSRLDKPYSCFDGTCNPAGPSHWFKAFIDGEGDIFRQQYTLGDNPFLDPIVADSIRNEYAGTVYYDRLVLGRWVQAEGAVYPMFETKRADIVNSNDYYGEIMGITIGVDFGGNRSASCFEAVGRLMGKRGFVVVRECHRKAAAEDPDSLAQAFVSFVREVRAMYPVRVEIYADSAEQVLIRGLQRALAIAGIHIAVQNAKKMPIVDRIRYTNRLIALGQLRIHSACAHLIESMRCAIYDDKKADDQRLDDFSYEMDPLDAFEYAIEPFIEERYATTMNRAAFGI